VDGGFAGAWVEAELAGVEGEVFVLGGGGGAAVFLVADDGMAGGLAVDADLVGAAGFELDFEQGCP